MSTKKHDVMEWPGRHRTGALMDHDFWQQRWRTGQIGFHLGEVNGLLLRHHAVLGVASRVLVPLCGKSRDMSWLAAQGHTVVGVELSRLAADAFFAEHQLQPVVDVLPCATRLKAGNIEIICGDFFTIGVPEVGAVNAWYDRAALIALPERMRGPYVAHCASLLSSDARGLLVTLDYTPAVDQGPPFSVAEAEVRARFAHDFTVTSLERNAVLEQEPRFRERGITAMHEQAYALRRVGHVAAQTLSGFPA